MRKRYVLDATRRGAPAGGDDVDSGDAAAIGRRRRVAAAALAIVGLLAGGWAVHAWLAPADTAPAATTDRVPEHQRSGPLANPWGNAAPVTSTAADDAAAATRASEAAAAASARSAAVADGAGSAASAAGPAAARPFSPPTPEAIRQALMRLRGGEGAGAGAAARAATAFVSASLQGGDGAALVAVWMAERQCRHFMHWRRIEQWRQRANPQAAGARARGAGLVPLCEAMPDASAVEEALAAAGFPPTPGGGPELTRRPVDLAQAVAVGDPLLLAEVLEATDGEAMLQLLRAYGADARDLEPPEVPRAALWLASCTPQDPNGRPGGAGVLKRACADHPALTQACMNHGLCDARDLRDLLLRSMSPGELATAERLGRGLVGRMGR